MPSNHEDHNGNSSCPGKGDMGRQGEHLKHGGQIGQISSRYVHEFSVKT